ncbi:MAG: [acyl-carrier-protein] S-malonyltransferase [Porticoccus sp.]|jgi:[acyl-carrier-protein] S-malonyltransferase|uniref:ACP S-malonyltransferase n=1 Tax=Porticoccus sp. TaxID=2024853 RepID=UPI0039E2D4BD|tara:strand:+ start:7900 stop:8835 length:936 start_codon:yes stop_codon:yes gene_type:complete
MKNNLAFVFPGQGSQKIGMLSELSEKYAMVQDTFAEASDVLHYDLWDMVQKGSQEDITLTERTQPLLLIASVAVWRIWQQEGGARPALMAGHSLGEWSALVCSGVVAFEDAVRLVRNRGAYMQEAVPRGEGAMAAILGLDDDLIEEICAKACEGQEVSAVNFNSPGQVVIAGNSTAVERAIEGCKAAGAKRAMPLPVSAPFHTGLMKPAADRLATEILATQFSAPEVLIVHNVNAKTESDPDRIKQLMIEQIFKPVQWVECVNTLVSAGIDTVVECGAGKVLGGLCKRIAPSLTTYATEDSDNLTKSLAGL